MKQTTTNSGHVTIIATTHLPPERVRQLIAYLDQPAFVARLSFEAEFFCRDLAQCVLAPGELMYRSLAAFWPHAGADRQREVLLSVMQPQLAQLAQQEAKQNAANQRAREAAKRGHLRIVVPMQSDASETGGAE